MNELKELEEQIRNGKRRCVCTEKYTCNTCKELWKLQDSVKRMERE